MKKAAPAPAPAQTPAEGPMGRIFGVRHLSPMGAWHVCKFLEQVQPTAILIEGPADATPLIEHFLHKKTQPPLAILAFTRKPPARSILFPLARYSPEWVAATWGARNRREVRFFDLPAGVFLGLEGEPSQRAPVSARRGAKEPPPADDSDTRRYLDDPWQEIPKLTGDPDYETWWERHFEQSAEDGAYQEAIYAFGLSLRELRDEAGRERQETFTREAYMRREIRRVIAEGHAPERVVVVCGAYHAPAMRWEIPPMSEPEQQALPHPEVTLALMPYSYRRLSSQSGYGAGNHAPAYYRMLWEELTAGTPGRLSARFLAEVAGRLRAGGMMRSSAEVIEAVRLAQALAALKGDRVAPTLGDLRDAAATLLGHGDAASIARHLHDIEIGDAVGSLPPGVAQTAIQEDFHRWIVDLNLADCLKDKEQTVRGRADKGEALDLREDRFSKSKSGAFRDRNVAIFLRRLAVLGVGFARDVTSPEDRRENTFKERWRARWTPECEVALAECSLLGDTIETAAVRKLEAQAAEADSVGAAARLVEGAVRCNLPSAVHAARRRLQELAVDDGALPSIAEACHALASTARYKDVSDVDVTPLRPLVAQLFLRAILVLSPASRCDDEASGPVGQALGQVHYVAQTDDTRDPLPVDRWYHALDAVADDERAHPFVAGVACALLLEAGRVDDLRLDQRVARRISPGMEPARCAGFFEGLASRNRMALLSRRKLWSALDEFLQSLDDGAFLRALPGLRRAFAGFEPGEARRVVDALGERWGSSADLSLAVETRIDDDEAAKLQEELGDLGDLDL